MPPRSLSIIEWGRGGIYFCDGTVTKMGLAILFHPFIDYLSLGVVWLFDLAISEPAAGG